MHQAKQDLIQALKLKRRSSQDIQEYLEAFDYLSANPYDYDGATIVKDLIDLRYSDTYLDADAMKHDYDYLMGANRDYIKKWKADYKYIKNMELNGKGIRVVRFVALQLIGVVYVPWNYLQYIRK